MNLIWIPRGLAIAFTLFFSVFALDSEGFLGLLIHLIPTFVLVLFIAFTWRQPLIAGIGWLVFGLATVIFFRTYQDWVVFLLISLVPILVGGSYLILKKFGARNKNATKKN